MVKRKVKVKKYSRVRKGKKEVVRKHDRFINSRPKINKKALEEIKTSSGINLIGIKTDEIENMKSIRGHIRGGAKYMKTHIDAYDYIRKDGRKVSVKAHDTGFWVWIPYNDSKFVLKKIRGEDRIVEVFKYKGKKYTLSVIDKRRGGGEIKQPEDLKYWGSVMAKTLPDNLMKAFKEVGKDNYEHSFWLDFERHLEQPERVAILKGGKSQTIKTRDFELFGHSHPDQIIPTPSTGDMLNLRALEPEFIVAGGSGKIFFMNIENQDKYEKWMDKHDEKDRHSYPYEYKDVKNAMRRNKFKDDKEAQKLVNKNYYDTIYRLLKTKKGREIFFDITGVKVYPYRKNLTLELSDLSHDYDKKFPMMSEDQLMKYHTGKK